MLYRDPAYLVCTDTNMPTEQILQAYLWRWEIEVNFREEKSIMGMGEAQVRTKEAVKAVPAFVAASYALMHLALAEVEENIAKIPLLMWRESDPPKRISTTQLRNQIRAEWWGKELGMNFKGFDDKQIAMIVN